VAKVRIAPVMNKFYKKTIPQSGMAINYLCCRLILLEFMLYPYRIQYIVHHPWLPVLQRKIACAKISHRYFECPVFEQAVAVIEADRIPVIIEFPPEIIDVAIIRETLIIRCGVLA
jgi:hypothetical protein